MLATLSVAFTQAAQDSKVLPPAEQEQVAQALEDDAEVMSNTRLEEQLAGQPADVKAEIIRINTDAGRSPCRSRCSCRSSRACSGCSTGSA